MQLLDFIQSIIAGGTATVIATQILKQNFIPLPFEKYPRLTAGVISAVSATVALYKADQTIFNQRGLFEWVVLVAGTALVAFNAYNQIKPTDRTSL